HLHVPRHLRIPPEVNNYLQNEGWEKVRLLQDEDEVLPGIRVFWAGVHHRSSMAVCIDSARGPVILTDCFFKYGNIEQGHYLGVYPERSEDLRLGLRSRSISALSGWRGGMNRLPFQYRIAVVTGAAAGIGFAVAQRFAEEGATVALLDQNDKEGRAALDKIKAISPGSEFYRVDVGAETEMRATMATISDRFRKVDHLVNNAGIVMVKTVEESSGEDWDRVMDVNVKSMFLAVKYLLPALRLAAQPTIVNMGS